MSKKFLVRILMLLAVLFVGVLWLISLIDASIFGAFKLNYAIAIICGVWGLLFLITGLFSKSNTFTKKSYVIIAIGFFIATVFAAFSSLGIEDKFIAPVIFIVVVAGLIFSYIASAGKKWDEGDNQKIGYKNYNQRKAEEEKAKEKENNK